MIILKEGHLETTAPPLEIDLTLSTQGINHRLMIILKEGHLATAATPPEIDLTLSTQGINH